MVLKSLEIQGFKSFPDRTTLNFGKGITAVVGPNGSGKSNISDAVRWVLGETSSKSLRGSKMEDVIFSGTSARKALGFAQVQLTLDNTDQTLKDKGEVVTVSRRYYRSGESEYKIDGETVRARDIRVRLTLSFLKKTRTGVNFLKRRQVFPFSVIKERMQHAGLTRRRKIW